MYYKLNYVSKIQPHVDKALATGTYATSGDRIKMINTVTQQFYDMEDNEVKEEITQLIQEEKQREEDEENNLVNRSPERYLKFVSHH